MQLTTREAVELALNSMKHVFFETNMLREDQDRMLDAAQIICDHYGFKLGQFFDVEEA